MPSFELFLDYKQSVIDERPTLNECFDEEEFGFVRWNKHFLVGTDIVPLRRGLYFHIQDLPPGGFARERGWKTSPNHQNIVFTKKNTFQQPKYETRAFL